VLCERGGVFDYVKVLDFGLVRMSQEPADLALTGTQALTGCRRVEPQGLRSGNGPRLEE